MMTLVARSAASNFAGVDQSEREHWRSIVLFGRNVASYKFALAKALLELAQTGNDAVRLEDLAVPFARQVCTHLQQVDRQGTFERSKFLDACRFYNAGRINDHELRTATVLLGFNNVIDAFHVVGGGEVPTRFFIDERSTSGGIRLTDEMLDLAALDEARDLEMETEARWRLVEEAWSSKAEGAHVVVLYDAPRELLVGALTTRRRSITEVRPALNGYQKGHCFYCFAPISLTGADRTSDVDHFLPHALMSRGLPFNLDSPWNLVLACSTCNRGPAGKFASLPHPRYLERLYRRNEFLIGSNHPLRETLMLTTGVDAAARRTFLRGAMDLAKQLSSGNMGWTANQEQAPLF
jgi:hypothetical protein